MLALAVSFPVFSNGQSDSDSGKEKEQLDVSAPGVYPIVEEVVNYSALFTAHQFVEDFETNKFTNYLEDLTNVHLDIEVVPADAATEKLNIIFAGGDYPDMLLVENMAKDMVVSYGSQGFFIPLNDLIEEHAPNLKAAMEKYPDFAAGMKTKEGTIYALPRSEGNWQVKFPVRAWVYEPWLEALDMEMPTDVDEYFDFLMAIKNGDPNGNGDTTDEVPLAGAITGWYTNVLPWVMNAYVFTDPNTYLIPQADKSFAFAPLQDEWKEGLRYLKKLYDNGLLIGDSFVQEQAQLRQMGENPGAPILGTATGGWWGNITINGGESGRYNEYTTLPALKGPDGVSRAPEYDHNVKPQFFITDKAENPEILVKWADFFFDYEGSMMGYYGFEGTEWRKAESGEIGVDGKPALHYIIETFGKLQNDTWHHRAPGFNTKEIIMGEAVEGDLMSHPTARLTKLTEDHYADSAVKAISGNLFFSEEDVNEVAELKAMLIGNKGSGIIPSYSARFITGDLDIDKDWNLFIKELEAANYKRYVEIYERTIAP